MGAISRAVHSNFDHINDRGDLMADEKLHLKIGNTEITIVAPTDPEVIKQAHEDFHNVSWEIWRSFTPEEQKKINRLYGEKRI